MTAWLRTGATILFWYASNIVVVISNKYLLTNYGFKYPIFLTGCHMVASGSLAYLTSLSGMVPKQSIKDFKQFWKVSLLACAFGLSIVLGNISLRYIPVSFSQAIGATTPFFTAMISLLVLYEWESPSTYASLFPVALGIVIASRGEPLFNTLGFVLALISTCARGFKSVLSAILLSDPSEKLNSMNLLLYMAPIAATALLPAMLIQERDVLKAVQYHARVDPYFAPALALNSMLSFLVNLSNFMVTKQTSALTVQVLGNAKGVVAAGVSILLFKNPITIRGGLGYAIALCGVFLYSHAKSQASKYQALGIHESPNPSLDVETSISSSPTIKSYPLLQRSPGKGLPLLDKQSFRTLNLQAQETLKSPTRSNSISTLEV